MEDLLRASGGNAGEALKIGSGARKEAISRLMVAAGGRYRACCVLKMKKKIESTMCGM